MRREWQDGFTAAGFTLYCCGAGADGVETKGQQGVGLAIKKSILHDAERDGLAVKYISARHMNVGLNLKGISIWGFLCGRLRSD